MKPRGSRYAPILIALLGWVAGAAALADGPHNSPGPGNCEHVHGSFFNTSWCETATGGDGAPCTVEGRPGTCKTIRQQCYCASKIATAPAPASADAGPHAHFGYGPGTFSDATACASYLRGGSREAAAWPEGAVRAAAAACAAETLVFDPSKTGAILTCQPGEVTVACALPQAGPPEP